MSSLFVYFLHWSVSAVSEMSLAQRVLLTWVFTLVFLIILVLKLDGKVQWNWFLVFLPFWVFDSILILMLAIKMAGRCKAGYDPRNGSHDLRLHAWYLMAIVLKLGFCLTLCAKLEKLADVKLTFVCIPLWTMLLGALVELGLNIFPERREA
nr:transmembrane protein 60-like isoform X1 [Monopterus albus]